MEIKKIQKAIDINAPKENVWDVLISDETTRQWYAAFSEGSHAETDWQEGSKAIFKDNSGCGMIAKIATSKPAEELVIEYTGILAAGKEDYESDGAKALQGGKEIYQLSEEGGITNLAISCDMGEEYFDMMSAAWDKALQKIKELAESFVVVP